MNIFYLDKDPVIAAQMSCDKHCIKMILESAQMLSTAHRVLDGDEYADNVGLYWLWKHMRALMREYTHRYGKIHATERLNEPLAKLPTNINFGNLYVDPPQCMPEECKGEDTVLAYQKYYIIEKSKIATWNKTRSAPKWWKEKTDEKKRGLLGLHGKKVA